MPLNMKDPYLIHCIQAVEGGYDYRFYNPGSSKLCLIDGAILAMQYDVCPPYQRNIDHDTDVAVFERQINRARDGYCAECEELYRDNGAEIYRNGRRVQ